MKKLTLKDYKEIETWIYRNARPMELALWQYYFEKGSKEAVLKALSFYQNDDGGFGHALEADSWNPNSSPYTTLWAINILKGIDFSNLQHPIMQGIFKFLESNVYCSENGWFFNIPSNDAYAHAPWWTYNMEANAYEGIGVTAGLISFIITNSDKNSKIFSKAMTLSDILFDLLRTADKLGDTGLGGYCILLDVIKRSELSSRFDYKSNMEKVKGLVNASIERDISKWVYYSRRPSDYIKSPESIFYKDNEDIVSKELDYTIDTRPENNVWNITWSWFENNEKYPKEFAVSENWWKASIAIDKIHLLKSFDRMDEF